MPNPQYVVASVQRFHGVSLLSQVPALGKNQASRPYNLRFETEVQNFSRGCIKSFVLDAFSAIDYLLHYGT